MTQASRPYTPCPEPSYVTVVGQGVGLVRVQVTFAPGRAPSSRYRLTAPSTQALVGGAADLVDGGQHGGGGTAEAVPVVVLRGPTSPVALLGHLYRPAVAAIVGTVRVRIRALSQSTFAAMARAHARASVCVVSTSRS
ncbi:hypothetical protein Pa4123_13280 [Phytohabitans aurantiacus]|uniref:Uncharacterized protein n=1 Tax=Phytohabitans aurantiacus TaxID=3016789 RepID=A0ABQ5QMY8_9ACTN|nr:hypothetical protein Pa4123_13280 [Phytohabitans aurantiacus]